MVLFQNCDQQSRSPTKMATTVQLRCYWKQLWSRWAITGSWEPLVLFFAWWPSWLEVGITGHIFGRGAPKDHSTKVWLQLSQWFLRRRLKCEMLTDVWRTKSDGNSSHGLKARWANKTTKGWRVSGHVIGYIYKTGYTHVYKTAKEIIFIIYMKDKVKMFKHHVLCLLLFINTLFFSYL